jgi:acyl-CoA reductase-like NAD-dependent aldehyde dehydrogenase
LLHIHLPTQNKSLQELLVAHLNFKVKCSSFASLYPQSLWPEVKEQLVIDVKSMKMGSPEDFSNFITAVIHEGSFDKLASFIDQAKKTAMLKL